MRRARAGQTFPLSVALARGNRVEVLVTAIGEGIWPGPWPVPKSAGRSMLQHHKILQGTALIWSGERKPCEAGFSSYNRFCVGGAPICWS